MAYPRATPYAPGSIVGTRTVLSEATIRPVGQHAPQLATHYLTRCACGREAWVLGRVLAKGQGDRCNRCSANRRARNYVENAPR